MYAVPLHKCMHACGIESHNHFILIIYLMCMTRWLHLCIVIVLQLLASQLQLCRYLLICFVCLVCYLKSTDCDSTDTIALAETADQCCTVAKSVLNPRTGSCMPCGSNPGM